MFARCRAMISLRAPAGSGPLRNRRASSRIRTVLHLIRRNPLAPMASTADIATGPRDRGEPGTAPIPAGPTSPGALP